MLIKFSTLRLKIDIVLNVKKSIYFCIDCNMKINLKLNGTELLCTGLNFKYLRVESGEKQHKLCIIPDKRIKKFTNAAVSMCRNTEQLPFSC